uniref:Uncharacterized protein n=1 Tax=Caenorhabditis japonica TaxID=281687 RepID=A0A8R1IL60_CAEJA
MIFILVLVGGAADDPVLERCDRSVMINIDIVGRYDVERKGGIPCPPTGSNGVPDIGIPDRSKPVARSPNAAFTQFRN